MSDDQLPVTAWPQARLDRVARLRVLAAGLPGTWVEERLIDAPFNTVWDYVSDLETSVPAIDSDVADLRILRRERNHIWTRVKTTSRFLGLSFHGEGDLEPGWCWIAVRPQLYVIGMAAEPHGNSTRFARLEGISLVTPPTRRALASPIHAISRWRHRRHLPHDVDNLARIVTARSWEG